MTKADELDSLNAESRRLEEGYLLLGELSHCLWFFIEVTGLLRGFDEIETQFTGRGECVGQGLDADLPSAGADPSNLASPDAIVDAGLAVVRRGSYCRTLLMCALGPPLWRSDRKSSAGGVKREPRTPEADVRSEPRRAVCIDRPDALEGVGGGLTPIPVVVPG